MYEKAPKNVKFNILAGVTGGLAVALAVLKGLENRNTQDIQKNMQTRRPPAVEKPLVPSTLPIRQEGVQYIEDDLLAGPVSQESIDRGFYQLADYLAPRLLFAKWLEENNQS